MSGTRFTGDEIEHLCSRCVSKSDDAQMQEISVALERVADAVYAYQFVGSGTYTSATIMQPTSPVQPKITLAIRSDTYRFTPQRDITAFEASRIMAILLQKVTATISAQDLTSWWDEAGPDIWRHFSAVG